LWRQNLPKAKAIRWSTHPQPHHKDPARDQLHLATRAISRAGAQVTGNDLFLCAASSIGTDFRETVNQTPPFRAESSLDVPFPAIVGPKRRITFFSHRNRKRAGVPQHALSSLTRSALPGPPPHSLQQSNSFLWRALRGQLFFASGHSAWLGFLSFFSFSREKIPQDLAPVCRPDSQRKFCPVQCARRGVFSPNLWLLCNVASSMMCRFRRLLRSSSFFNAAHHRFGDSLSVQADRDLPSPAGAPCNRPRSPFFLL